MYFIIITVIIILIFKTVQDLRIYIQDIFWTTQMLLLCLEYPCKGHLLVIIFQSCFHPLALLSSKTTSCKAFGSWRDVASLPLICPYIKGKALLGPNGTGGDYLLRLPTLDGSRALTSLDPVQPPRSPKFF